LTLHLRVQPGLYSVVRLPPRAKVPAGLTGFHCITRTPRELSIVCRERDAPGFSRRTRRTRRARREDGFRCLVVAGPIPFDATGVLSSLAAPLARARIPILAISTFDTDYVFVRRELFDHAVRALSKAGHRVRLA
jgi:hypothetical protein